jgi:hypothetical protein
VCESSYSATRYAEPVTMEATQRNGAGSVWTRPSEDGKNDKFVCHGFLPINATSYRLGSLFSPWSDVPHF